MGVCGTGDTRLRTPAYARSGDSDPAHATPRLVFAARSQLGG